MCGINGIFSLHRDVAAIARQMNRHLGHRGPDGDGVFVDGPVALGHVRLSILDLTPAGAQPMAFGRWVLVFNGEIYNFPSLRDTLVARGYSFTSRSDTEVLLKAWDCWEQECLERLDGMFAFAVFDTEDGTLHLCRDSYGVKPLFYSVTGDEFLFSSELATLVRAQSIPLEPDRDALATFLALHYVPAPQTGYLRLFKLPPGHRMTVRMGDLLPQPSLPVSWHTPFKPQDDKGGVSIETLNEALSRSVRQQMISDVPVGAFLSGGVDSSLICHYASLVNKEPLHTFSIGFRDAGPEYDETVHAARVAELLGTRHHVVQIELCNISQQLDDLVSRFGELNADSSVFLNNIVCAAARKHVTVCLSGAGGDEMFGGYYRHQALLWLKLLCRVPQPMVVLCRVLLALLPQNRDSRIGNLVRRVVRFLEQREGNGNFVDLLRHDRVYPQESRFLQLPGPHSLVEALQFDFRHFLGDNILSFSDKMSMLYGLEVRVPFLNPEVVRLAEQLKNSQRVTLVEKKVLLKQLAARYFPRDIVYRKKQGFAAPLEVCLRQFTSAELKRRCSEGLASEVIPEALICSLTDLFLEKRRDLSLQLFACMVMNRWHDTLCRRSEGACGTR